MKRLILVVLLLLVVLYGGALLAFNAGLFHSYIEREVAAALGPGSKVHFGRMELEYRWPPLLRVGQSAIESEKGNVQWSSLSAELRSVFAPYALYLRLVQPLVVVKPQATASPAATSGTGGRSSRTNGAIPLALQIEVVNGQINSPLATIKSLNLKFAQSGLMGSLPAKVHLEGIVRANAFPVDFPFRVESEALIFNATTVRTESLILALGGLQSKVHGTSLLSEGRHRWLIEAAVKDLSKLPQPPMNIPARNWGGEVRLKAEVNKATADQPWSAEGDFLAKKVRAELNYKNGKVEMSGNFQAEGEGRFSYFKEQLALPQMKAALDFSDAQLTYQDMLNKVKGRPLKASLQANGDQKKLNLQDLSFQMDELAGQITGSMEMKAPWASQLQFALRPANLQGIERLLLPLKSSPVQGQLSMAAKFDGPLSEPLKGHITLTSLVLKKFYGVFGFERPGSLKLRGPVSMDVDASGECANGQVKVAQGRGALDLSAAGLVVGPIMKQEGATLKSNYSLRTSGNTIQIDRLDLTGFLGSIRAKGKVEQGIAPQLNMTVEASPISLTELRLAMPSMRDQIPKGNLRGNWQIGGRLEMSKPWVQWPLVVTGAANVQIPEYKMVEAQAGGTVSEPSPATPSPRASGFLPDGVLTRKARLNFKVQLDQLQKSTLVARNIGLEGIYSGGQFSGQLNVRQIFGGSVQVKKMLVPLLQIHPKISGSVNWQNLVIEEAMAFAKPEYKTFASGKTTGLADFATVIPERPDFLQSLKVRGDLVAQPVTFNTVKIGALINEQIAKIPALKVKPVKVEPLQGKATVQFILNGGVVEIPKFTGVDLHNSEIQLKGKVVLSSMLGDLAGNFYWQNPPLKGCALEGNADASGRMVVPLAIKGDLMKPGFNILSDVLNKLAAKTIECEGKKLVEKVKADGKKALEKEAKKALKDLFGK